jgi:hypothetical protein
MRAHGTEAPGSCALPQRLQCTPPPTHVRYCINGVAMSFQPE